MESTSVNTGTTAGAGVNGNGAARANPQPPIAQMDVTQLTKMTIVELNGIARNLKLEGISGLQREQCVDRDGY